MKLSTVVLILFFFVACSSKKVAISFAPTIISVDTTVVREGDVITVRGTNFSSVKDENVLAVAGIRLTITEAGPEVIKARIPTGARSGVLFLTLPGGRTATFGRAVSVIQLGQPFVSSVNPNTDLVEGDTITIKGVAFSDRLERTGVTVSGAKAQIINTNDTVITALVPRAKPGNLVVSVDDLLSLPYALNLLVSNLNPLLDGRIYFSILTPVTPGTGRRTLVKGADDESPTGGKIIYDRASTVTSGTIVPIVGRISSDAQDNLYCLGSLYQSSFQGYNYITQITIDGDNVSLKTDLKDAVSTKVYPSQPSSVLASRIGDLVFYSPEGGTAYALTQNFFFTYSGQGQVNTNKREYRNLLTSEVQNITPLKSVTIVSTATSSEHGDSILFYVRTVNESQPKGKLLVFDPVSGVLKMLYDETNWIDSKTGKKGQNLLEYNQSFLWVGSNIYYANSRREALSTQLLRLKSDGSTKRPVIIYERLEAESQPKASSLSLFIKRSEAQK